ETEDVERFDLDAQKGAFHTAPVLDLRHEERSAHAERNSERLEETRSVVLGEEAFPVVDAQRKDQQESRTHPEPARRIRSRGTPVFRLRARDEEAQHARRKKHTE